MESILDFKKNHKMTKKKKKKKIKKLNQVIFFQKVETN